MPQHPQVFRYLVYLIFGYGRKPVFFVGKQLVDDCRIKGSFFFFENATGTMIGYHINA